MSSTCPVSARGRYAPSPTGLLHVGNARTALAAWLSVRAAGGAFIWRTEDLDPPRILPGAAEAALADLTWLGLDWDEGPDRGGPYPPYRQSRCGPIYEEALDHLFEAGRLFPCRISRKDLLMIASAPHGAGETSPYPPDLRPVQLDASWLEDLRRSCKPEAAIRFRVHTSPVSYTDYLHGTLTERVDLTVGDFVLKRRDGLYAYQLAVVVDDLRMQITEVVRGMDLLASTARQIQLIEALGGTVPAYAHLPLVLNASGEKLSKRDYGITLRDLRATGVLPEQLTGYLACSLGLLDRPTGCHARDLIPLFDWSRIPRKPWVLPENIPALVRGIK